MAGRGGFKAITHADVERLLAQPEPERWDFTADGMQAVFEDVPPAVHDCPSETHWSAAQVPLTQSKLQQSMALAHEPPVVLHIGCAHRCVFASQRPA